MKFISFLLLLAYISCGSYCLQKKLIPNEFLSKFQIDVYHKNTDDHLLDFPLKNENNSSEEEEKYEKETEKLETENKLKAINDFWVFNYSLFSQNLHSFSSFNCWNYCKHFHFLKVKRFLLFSNLRD